MLLHNGGSLHSVLNIYSSSMSTRASVGLHGNKMKPILWKRTTGMRNTFGFSVILKHKVQNESAVPVPAHITNAQAKGLEHQKGLYCC